MQTVRLPFVTLRQEHLARWRIGEALARLPTRLVARWELRGNELEITLNVGTEQEADAFALDFLDKLAEVYTPTPYIPERDA